VLFNNCLWRRRRFWLIFWLWIWRLLHNSFGFMWRDCFRRRLHISRNVLVGLLLLGVCFHLSRRFGVDDSLLSKRLRSWARFFFDGRRWCRSRFLHCLLRLGCRFAHIS
jgi:hypothetical protein